MSDIQVSRAEVERRVRNVVNLYDISLSTIQRGRIVRDIMAVIDDIVETTPTGVQVGDHNAQVNTFG